MSVIYTLKPLSLLFISSCFIMFGHGLSGLLIPVRLTADSQEISIIGFILSMFSVGFLLGAIVCKKILKNIGIIRTFAFCGGICSASILIMGITEDLWVWSLCRAILGFGIACATASLDTWFNSVAIESNRGKIMAINQVFVLTAITLGQFGLVIAEPTEVTLFIICGLVFSLSIIPVVFISKFEPEIEKNESLTFKALYFMSPLGFVTCFVCGLLYSTALNLFPIYFDAAGIQGFRLSLFMGMATIGAVLFQMPMGYFSDSFGRKGAVVLSCISLLVSSYFLPISIESNIEVLSLCIIAVVMGMIACLYPLSISEVFDKTATSQMVSVLSTLLCVYGLGAIIGPYSVSLWMEYSGPKAIFSFVWLMIGLLLIFTLYRIQVRPSLPKEKQEQFVVHIPNIGAEELDPRTVLTEHSIIVDEIMDQMERLALGSPNSAIAFIRSITTKHPEWAVVVAGRAASIESIDTVTLFRAITITNPELSLDIVRNISNSTPEEIETFVEWLIEKKPENCVGLLATISESIQYDAEPIIDIIMEKSPDLLGEFSQQLAKNMFETASNIRQADKQEGSDNYDFKELIASISRAAPEQLDEIHNLLAKYK
ncbi:MFS transporter [Vibrio ziniensis]|uniref:MFS transporter n=1 Tax=Vibrio ziniensis TaxID=2711221 RepID=A0A6G7CP65_9VIBR|nr:MFS transporter [Vibrio ziniensis]QIH43879.1 MFS transporter [Vibrio ziniensis]